MLKKIKFILSIFSFLIILAFLTFSKTISNAVIEGLIVCKNILIPSMFVFLIISEFFYKINALSYILKPFNFLCEKLFKIDRKIGPVLFFSLICGYPAGANLIGKLVEEKKIDLKTANRMLYFCVNAGPSFLIGSVSIPLTKDIALGMLLFISQIITFFIIGTLSSIGEPLKKINIIKKEKPKISESLISSTKNSIKNMAIICGFSIFFSAIVHLFFNLNIFNINSHFYIKPIFAGLLEVTNGILQCFQINNIHVFLIVVLITSFGGICVHFQVMSITSKYKISFKNFYLWRILYCLINITIATLLFSKFSTVITIFSKKFSKEFSKENILIHKPIISISLIILSIALLCCEKKITIIKKKLFKKKLKKIK